MRKIVVIFCILILAYSVFGNPVPPPPSEKPTTPGGNQTNQQNRGNSGDINDADWFAGNGSDDDLDEILQTLQGQNAPSATRNTSPINRTGGQQATYRPTGIQNAGNDGTVNSIDSKISQITQKVTQLLTTVESLREENVQLQKTIEDLPDEMKERPAPDQFPWWAILLASAILAGFVIFFILTKTHIENLLIRFHPRIHQLRLVIKKYLSMGYAPFYVKKRLYIQGYSKDEIEFAFRK